MDEGAERIEEDEILAQVRKQARKVNRDSFLYSLLFTALVVFVPLALFGV